ncbi:amino acid adenylation domain-containing protein [Streptomyces sp. A1277]|uniref:non-ribosomal peptide synthetase n=1 Tax=Streptomyces sp. A1277 TaxID=2563103 RepID=UPI0010A26A80|nr:non-ribosomal peptide synthetase [Streptomyces sp. A1277]THA28002.1 amino acid adenylation domain-containing protein [Streptomyces sp. A1277]
MPSDATVAPAPAAFRLPLSEAQRDIWTAHTLDPTGLKYNVAECRDILGPVDPELMAAAWRRLVEEADVMRTRCFEDDGETVWQLIDAEPGARQLPFTDVSAEDDPERAAWALVDEAVGTAFDLTRESPVRCALIKLADDRYFYFYGFHHLLVDGVSVSMLLKRLVELYETAVAGESWGDAPFGRLADLHAEDAAWRSSEGAAAERTAWRAHLAGAPETPHSLVRGNGRAVPSRGALPFSRRTILVPAADADRLRAVARAERVSWPVLVVALFTVYLHRVTAQDELMLALPVTGRTTKAARSTPGMTSNVVPLRLRVGAGETLHTLVRAVSAEVKHGLRHQLTRYEDLRRDAGALTGARRLTGPVLNIMGFNAGMTVCGNPTINHNVSNGPVDDLSVAVYDLGAADGLRIDFDTPVEGVDADAIAAHQDRFAAFLTAALAPADEQGEPADRRVAELEVLSADERELLLGAWAGTVVERDDVSLVERFEEQVARSPEAVALIDGERRYTYAELNATANRWARLLRSRGLRRGDLAGVLLERNASFAAAVIAVVKAGAGYTLLDPDFPDERLRGAADDAGIALLLTDDALGQRLEGPWTVVSCSSGAPADESDADSNLGLPLVGDDVACVMFTSGSTGRPKGILSSHRNLVSTVTAQTYGQFGPGETFLQCSPVSWDAFSLEFWGALLHGATTVLQPGQKPEPALITELSQQHRVTMLQLSASLFNYLTDEHPDAFTTVTTAYTGGETASPTHIHQLHQTSPHTTVINGYGPAESMGFTTTHTITPTPQPHTTIPIGSPLTNKAAYILDTTLQPTPPGTTGHLYLTGHGLAHGYLNRPDLTATHFIPNPYGPPGTRLYHTGDLAHFDQHGHLHYDGRADTQLKIRGFRIEPNEVETALLTHPHITQATITTHHDELSAYVVIDTGTVTVEDIRRHLTDRLPDHMVPAHLTPLDRLPLTPNGKIDKRALPEPAAAVSAARAPQTPLEEVTVALFGRVLGTSDPVGVDDSFFAHGGHSLLAARLTNHIADVLGLRLTIRDVFQHPTPARLAQHISTLKGRPALPPLVAGAWTGEDNAPVSFAQRRLWLLAELDGGSAAYNVPMAVRLAGPLDVDALETALNDVVERHAPLRTVFATVDGEPRQHVLPAARARVAIERRMVTADALDEAMTGAARHVFDLGSERPLRASLFEVSDGSWVFFLLLHHIATDGRSTGVFFDDLSRAYEARIAGAEGQVLEPLPVQYADYAVWQQRVLGAADDADSVLAQELAFWHKTLERLPEEHALNLDRPRPARASHRGGQIGVELGQGLFEQVSALARAEGCTPFMVVHAALAAALTRLGAGTDLAIGSPVAGRTDEALRDLVGFFVNTLVLRTHTDGNPTFRELLEHVRTTDLDAFAHQDAPFDLVLDTLNPTRTLSRHPLFQICLTLDAGETPVLNLGDARATGIPEVTSGAAKFDLEFLLRSDDGQGLRGTVLFAEDLFDRSTVQRMVAVLGKVLRQALADPELRLGELDVLSDTERELLLGPWAGSVADIGDASLVERFEEQVARSPEAVALIDGERRYTYAELNATANRWARHLRARGLGRGDLAGILLERDVSFAAALIAVLKTGAAHVLLDPDFPDERLHSAAGEAGISHLVTRPGLADRLEGAWSTCVEGPDEVSAYAPDNLGLPIEGNDVACVMFTSGSTGRPKGILSSHRNLVSTVTAQTYGQFGPGETFLQCSPVSWDAFSLEFWGALLHGATTVLQPGQKPEPALITELSQQHRVTMLQLSASLFNYLTDEHPDAFTTVTTAYTGGETASPTHIHQLHQTSPHTTVINGYGPAESMGFTTTHTITPTPQPHTTIPIGSPLTNKAAYILDTTLQPTPPGTTGHLYLTGHGLAHGYLNRPDLTATHFIPNPYGPPGTRLYHTGDLAHFDQHGHLHYDGRADTQLKIRGFRIEPNEVETALLTHPHITQAVVTTHRDQLSAHVVASTDTLAMEDVRRHLTARLPEHLVPTYLTPLDRLPLTPNGKIDKRALPEPAAVVSAGGRAPRTSLEETLVGLFTRTLGAGEALSIDDDFFHHGGHSLLGARLTNHIAVALDVRLTVRDVFEHPTPARLAEHITALKSAPAAKKKARPALRRRTETERISS